MRFPLFRRFRLLWIIAGVIATSVLASVLIPDRSANPGK